MVKFDCSRGQERLIFEVSCRIAARVIARWLKRDGWDFNMSEGTAKP